ncbi:hypothetical protein GF342_02350 [Candidatus Woesearchaeota archaeon]|nr:hypothetical protein [Candidatus Woesearchaeota archaeon]
MELFIRSIAHLHSAMFVNMLIHRLVRAAFHCCNNNDNPRVIRSVTKTF